MKRGMTRRRIAMTLLCFVVIIVQSGFAAWAEPVPGSEDVGTDSHVADAMGGDSVTDAVYGDDLTEDDTVREEADDDEPGFAPLSTEEEDGLPELHAFGRNSMGELALDNGGSTQLAPELVTAFPGLHIFDIAVGLSHSVVLSADGEVYAVGANNKGQLGNGTIRNSGFSATPVMVDLSGVDGQVVAIDAGDTHTLLLTDNGKVYGFGDNSYGQLGFASEVENVTLPTPLPVNGEMASIEANYYMTFLVTTDGEVYATGRNQYGKLGLGLEDTDENIYGFKKVTGFAPEATVKSISTGSRHTFFVMDDGSLYAAGSVPALSGTAYWVEPTLVTDFSDEYVVSASAGSTHSLVLTANGRVYAFGQTSYGQLGLDPAEIDWETLPPTELSASLFGDEKVVMIQAASNFSLVLTESRKVYSFGQDSYTGQGINTADDVTLPREITPAGVQVTKIAAQRFHSLLLTLGPSVYDYPDPPANITVTPGHRQLTVSFTPPVYDGGTPVTLYTVNLWNDKVRRTITGTSSPITIEDLMNAVEYKVTVKSTNARGTSQESAPPIKVMPGHPTVPGYGLFALGDNGNGQLGFGDYANRGIPELIPGLPEPVAFAAGLGHSLVAGSDGNLYVFGTGTHGQLGLGDNSPQTTPVVNPVLSGESIRIAALSGGDFHSLAVTTSGELYAFGRNNNAQLGDPSLNDRVYTPVRVMEDVRIVEVSAGWGDSLVLSEEGDVYKLGWIPELTPEKIVSTWPEDERPIAISEGSAYALILTDKGKVYSFGHGGQGRLGHGDEEYQWAPKWIEGLPADDPAIAVHAGGTSSMVITASGDVYVFGDNQHGQLGLGDTTHRLAPTRVEALAGKRAVAGTITMSGYQMFIAVESEDGYEVYGSGVAGNGQLGIGNDTDGDRSSPTPITAFAGKRIVQFSAGGNNVLAHARRDDDTTPPAPVSIEAEETNAYVDVTFDEGVYGNPNGASGLWAGDFRIEFSENGGNAKGARVSYVRQPDGETPEEASMPDGGETTLRLFLSIDGDPTGVEEVAIYPVHRLAIFDEEGTPIEAETLLGSFVLTDITPPFIAGAERSSDTEIILEFSEGVIGLDDADPADFTVVETGSDGSVNPSLPS